MYMTNTINTDNKFRACRTTGSHGETIWIQNDDVLTMALSLAETKQLIAELTRELWAAEALARGVAA